MTSAIRRSSAFSLGSKPPTPRANTDTVVNPLAGKASSKAASISSVVDQAAIEAPTTAEREPSVGATTAESAAPTEESKVTVEPVEPVEPPKEPDQPHEETIVAPAPVEEPVVVAPQPIEPAGILDPAWTAIPALEDPIPEMRLRPVRNLDPEPIVQTVEDAQEPISEAPQEITPSTSEGLVEEPLPQSESPTALSRATSRDNLKHESLPLSPILESPVTATNDSAPAVNNPKEKDGDIAPVQDGPPPPVFIPVNPAAVNPPILVVPMPHPRTAAPSDESSDGPTPRPGEGAFNFTESVIKNKSSMTYMKAMPVDPEQQQQHPEGFVIAVPTAAPPMPVPEPAEVPKTAPIPIPQPRGVEQNPSDGATEYP